MKSELVIWEKTIDEIDQDLPVLRNFLFLGGSQSASFLYLARSVCRRVERQICQMSQRRDLQSLLPTYVGISQMGKVLVYLNRLSDFLFVLARFENQINKVKEKILKK